MVGQYPEHLENLREIFRMDDFVSAVRALGLLEARPCLSNYVGNGESVEGRGFRFVWVDCLKMMSMFDKTNMDVLGYLLEQMGRQAREAMNRHQIVDDEHNRR